MLNVLGSCGRPSSSLLIAKVCKITLPSAIFATYKPLANDVNLSAEVAASSDAPARACASCSVVQTVSDGCCRHCSSLPVAKARKIAPLLAIFSTCKPLTDGVARFATAAVCSDAPVRVFSCCPMEQTVLGSCCAHSSLLPVARTREGSLLSAIFIACQPLVDCVSRSAAVAACSTGGGPFASGQVAQWCPLHQMGGVDVVQHCLMQKHVELRC